MELYGATVFGPEVFEDLVGYVEFGSITPVVGASYPLEAIGDAQDAFSHKAHVGAIVLTVDNR